MVDMGYRPGTPVTGPPIRLDNKHFMVVELPNWQSYIANVYNITTGNWTELERGTGMNRHIQRRYHTHTHTHCIIPTHTCGYTDDNFSSE